MNKRLSLTCDEKQPFRLLVMRSQRGSLYGTSSLQLAAELPYPPGGPRYERLAFNCAGRLIVPLNE